MVILIQQKVINQDPTLKLRGDHQCRPQYLSQRAAEGVSTGNVREFGNQWQYQQLIERSILQIAN